MPELHDRLRGLFPSIPIRRREPNGVKIRDKIDISRYLPFRIHRISVQLAQLGPEEGHRESDVLFSSFGLRLKEWRLLMLLASCGPLTNSELADVANMNEATISRTVTNLIEKGLLTSASVPTDRRRTMLALTPDGAKLYHEIAAHRIATFDRLESCLTQNERQTFYNVLDKFEAHIRKSTENKADKGVVWDE